MIKNFFSNPKDLRVCFRPLPHFRQDNSKSSGNRRSINYRSFLFILTEQIRKPGSVLNDSIIIYLDLLSPKGSRDLTRKLDGPPNTFLCGLAPDGVYLAGLLPNRRCALTAPFHPYPVMEAVYFCGTIPEVALAGR